MQALSYFLISFSNECSWKFMPANSLDGIIRVSTCKVRSKLNYLLFAFLKFLVFAQFVTILPFFTLINKHISSYRNSMDATEVALMQVRGKKETEVCTTISKKSLSSHICLQQGPVFQSNHIYNDVTIALLFQNIHVAWAVQGLKCAALMCTLTPVPQLVKLQTSWAFLLSIGFNTDMLPLTSIKPLSRNMLPHSASWFVFKWSSSHKPNDSLQFYKHIHVCCQTHELVFCRLLQESNH